MRIPARAGRVNRTAAQPGVLVSGLAVLAASAATTGLLIVLFLGSMQAAISVLGIVGLVTCFALSGNQRLFCLWGLLLTAPLGVQKAFWISSHMGGASAITIDLPDLFLFPLLAFIVRDMATGRRARLRVPAPLMFWGGMMLLGLGSLAVGPYRQLAALELIRMTKTGLLFFVLVNEIVRVRQMLHVAAALVIDIGVQTVFAVAQYIHKGNLGLQFLGEPVDEATTTATKSVYLGTGGEIFRAGGLFSHPNLLAGFLAMLLPICIALIFSRARPVYKLGLGIAISLGLGVLLITLSRSGWMSFAAAFALLFVFSMLHQKLRLRYVLARLAVIAGILVGAGAASGEILRRITSSDPGALKFRFEMMDTAWSMIAAHPVFGLGLNTFVAYFPLFAPRPGPTQVTADYGAAWPIVHDSYLITWTEQGTLGFLCLCGIYFSTLWLGLRTLRFYVDEYAYAINLGACCGIVAIMIDGIGSFFINENQGQRMFWIVVALIVAVHEWTSVNRPLRLAQQAKLARTAVPA